MTAPAPARPDIDAIKAELVDDCVLSYTSGVALVEWVEALEGLLRLTETKLRAESPVLRDAIDHLETHAVQDGCEGCKTFARLLLPPPAPR